MNMLDEAWYVDSDLEIAKERTPDNSVTWTVITMQMRSPSTASRACWLRHDMVTVIWRYSYENSSAEFAC